MLVLYSLINIQRLAGTQKIIVNSISTLYGFINPQEPTGTPVGGAGGSPLLRTSTALTHRSTPLAGPVRPGLSTPRSMKRPPLTPTTADGGGAGEA